MKKALALGCAVAIAVSTGALAQEARPPGAALAKTMDAMMSHLHAPMSGDVDRDFATLMAALHQAALDLAKAQLDHGKDPELRELARRIVAAQEREIALLKDWLVRAQADDHH